MDTILLLLKSGAELESRLQDGRTPLHVAVAANQAEAVSCLITNGANIHLSSEVIVINVFLKLGREGIRRFILLL